MGGSGKKRKVNAKGRNVHDRFVKLDHWLLGSSAYRLLSPAARTLLVEFMRLYNGSNNGQLYMSQRDAAKVIGLKTHGTAAKYLKELQERGFIRVIVPGSFDNKTRLASVYALTNHDCGKVTATKDFMRLRLTDAEKQRIKEMVPSWLENRPTGVNSLPVGMSDELQKQARIG